MFTDNHLYWGEIPKGEMEFLLKKAKRIGWREAMRTHLLPHSPSLYQYATEIARSDFRFLVPLTSESVVLDMGCGWGTIASALAPHCQKVYALERVRERADLLQLRKSDERINNLDVIQGDIEYPPFPPSSFDFVIMNGVLEWIGVSGDGSPLERQKKVLAQVYRLLRPKGMLYMGIENRWGYPFFFGAKDHSGLPFTSLLPRWMASLILKWKNHSSHSTNFMKRYCTLTHSALGYKKLLHGAGFDSVHLYLALPDYSRPLYFIPWEDPAPLQHFLKILFYPVTKRQKVLSYPIGFASVFHMEKVLRHFSPSFAILVEKGI